MNNINTKSIFKLNKWGDFLGTRELGVEIRQEIINILKINSSVTIDFEGINMISHSFADEFVGKLVGELTSNIFKDKIRFSKVAPEIAPIIRYVINSHLKPFPKKDRPIT